MWCLKYITCIVFSFAVVLSKAQDVLPRKALTESIPDNNLKETTIQKAIQKEDTILSFLPYIFVSNKRVEFDTKDIKTIDYFKHESISEEESSISTIFLPTQIMAQQGNVFKQYKVIVDPQEETLIGDKNDFCIVYQDELETKVRHVFLVQNVKGIEDGWYVYSVSINEEGEIIESSSEMLDYDWQLTTKGEKTTKGITNSLSRSVKRLIKR